ncbi:Protein of unknown function DUF2993 [Actinobacteria bacterium OK074]|nr:Protein of unknown function DUF2993 [Actinobacteria bacterium OK074]
MLSVMTLLRRGSGRGRGGRRGARFLALGVVAAVLLTGVVTEAVVRHRTAARLADRMETRLHTGVDVGLGPTPVLLQLARGSFPRVQVSGSDATFRKFTGVDLHARLDDVTRSADGLSVRDSRVRAEMPDDALAGTVAAATGGAPTVTADPDASQLIVHAGPLGQISIAYRPTLRDDGIHLERTSVHVGERTVPDALADRLLQGTPQEFDLSGLPLDLKPERLTVTADGLRLDLTGGPATVKT